MADDRCKHEGDCTHAPWCRIHGECQRAITPKVNRADAWDQLERENAELRRALEPFASVAVTPLRFAVVRYGTDTDPERQTFQTPWMHRAFNRAAEVLREHKAGVTACQRCGGRRWVGDAWENEPCPDCAAGVGEVGEPSNAVRWAIDRLEYYLDAVDQVCDCEECPQCQRLPAECSGTECAKTCQCSECDHCQTKGALEALRRTFGVDVPLKDQPE